MITHPEKVLLPEDGITKVDLAASVRNALQKMPKESEPVLIQAIKGEGDFAKLAEGYPDRAFVPVVAGGHRLTGGLTSA